MVGLERHVHACLDGFLDELRRIVKASDEHHVHTSNDGDGDRYTLPQLAHSYQLLTIMANLRHFSESVIGGKLAEAYSDILGDRINSVLVVPTTLLVVNLMVFLFVCVVGEEVGRVTRGCHQIDIFRGQAKTPKRHPFRGTLCNHNSHTNRH